MQLLKVITYTIVFVAVYGAVDLIAGATAPVLGPIVLVGLIAALIYATYRIWKWGQK